MVRYPEVHTGLGFVSICTMPLDLRVEKNINLYAETNDYELLLPLFWIKLVIIKRTYQIGVKTSLTKGL